MFYFRRVGQLRKYFDRPAAVKLIHAVILSRLDYGNFFLFYVVTSQLSRLQRIQNTAARVVHKANRFTHPPILVELHQLPTRLRTNYKILILSFRDFKTSRPVRFNYQFQLQVPMSRTKSFGDRSFLNGAPRLWNSLKSTTKDFGFHRSI